MRVLLILLPFVAVTWAQSSLSIIDYLHTRRVTDILQSIEEAGLTSTLNGTDNYTIFAPSDSAYGRLDPGFRNDTAKMADLVKYQIIRGAYRLADVYNEEQLTSLQSSSIRINHYLSTGKTTAQGQLIFSEVPVSNGVVNLMYVFLRPSVGNVLDVIAKDGNLTTLRKVIQTAGLDNFFQEQNPITLFAPTDSAFNFLGSTKLQALLSNPTLLASFLKFHVIPGTLYSAGFHSAYMHTFQEPDKLKINHRLFNDAYEIEGSPIEYLEQSATNGLVYRIADLLIPPSLTDQFRAL